MCLLKRYKLSFNVASELVLTLWLIKSNLEASLRRVGSKFRNFSTFLQQVSNKDRSSIKQLAWERHRHSDFKGPGKFSAQQKFKKKFPGKPKSGFKKKR